MEIQEIVTEIVVGIFLLWIAFQIGYKENIQLIHRYHYINVDRKDLKVYTTKMAKGTLGIGIGVILMPIINMISGSEAGYYVGLLSIILGILFLIYVVIKYNGSLFGLRKK